MSNTVSQPGSSFRDPRLDFFRGLCLVMIFINHVPGTAFESLTSRNFGLSDAAEGFVFMSGCAVALAYGRGLEDGLSRGPIFKAWTRSWQLYLTHLGTSLWAIAVVAGAAILFGAEAALTSNSFGMMQESPYEVLLGLATLGHQFGYVNILPLYAILMLMAPFLVRLSQTAPGSLIAGSVAVWMVAAGWQVNLPNFPQPGGWFFNPFSWQLVFTLGIVTGTALRARRRFVPVRWWAALAAAAWLVFCLVWVKSPTLTEAMKSATTALGDAGAPYVLVAFDKTYVTAPRLLHFLALVYVLSLTDVVRSVAASELVRPVQLMGRHSLPVFATSTVLAIAAQAVKMVHPAGFGQDAVLIVGGLAGLWGLATLLDYFRAPRLAPAVAPMPVDNAAPNVFSSPAA